MSRVYFHSEHGDAELAGSERAWLSWIASGPARAYWNLDGSMADERAIEIMSMVKHGSVGWLFEALAKAEAESANNERLWAEAKQRGIQWPNTTYEAQKQLIRSLDVALRVQGIPLQVAGVELASSNIELNTALAVGNEPLALAAKIQGWCECHCWVEGPDRKWMADVIDDGLRIGMYRRGLWYEPAPGAEKQWAEQGWDGITSLLRSRDDEPVVLSYSVCDRFPNPEIAGWPDSAKFPVPDMDWYELSSAEKWDLALTGLRRRQPWAQISPNNLFDVTFHLPVTVFDLFAPDRDDRVRNAATGVEA